MMNRFSRINLIKANRDNDREFITDRAITYLNFAMHLRINRNDAIMLAFDSIDDDSNQFDIDDAPIPMNAQMHLLALANESYSSDDDFDDFLHELHHIDYQFTECEQCDFYKSI